MKFKFKVRGYEAIITGPNDWQIGYVMGDTFEIFIHARMSVDEWKSLMATVEEASKALSELRHTT